MKSVPKNKSLYSKIKSQAKKKFKVYPSAYANSWVVRKYKEKGGTYSGSRKKSRKRLLKSIKKFERKRSRKTKKSKSRQ